LEELFVAEENLGPALLERGRARKFAISDPVTIPAVQRVLGSDEILIEYVLAEPISYALAISKSSLRVHRLPAASLIRDLVGRFRQEIASNREPLPATTRRLYSALVTTVPEIREHRRLIIVPDGLLHLLPFDVLEAPNGRYLGDDHIVSFSLSGTVLQILRNAVRHQPASARLLAVGITDPPVSASGVAAVLSTDERTRAFFDAAGAQLPPLPATAEEIHFIAGRAGPSGVILRGSQATESGFRRQPLGSFGAVHLALHGVADAKFPERSALVFRRDEGSQDDGLLQVREIRSLQFTADLVTLSACETGLGRVEGQEGMANLVRAFLFAGARNVAAALWQVDDVFTSALMKSFYTRLAEGDDVSRALQRAKADIRTKFGNRAKPYHWAGFVVAGEGRAQLRFGHAAESASNTSSSTPYIETCLRPACSPDAVRLR
jgi:CHAT domain-containing protein